MEKWNKSTAVVTGANSGIGFGILRKLAAAGISVIGFDINIDAIEKFKGENGTLKVFSRICNVTSDKAVEEAFNWVEDTFGGVDILVNNAGVWKNVGVLEVEKPMSELAFSIDLNFTAAVRCVRLAYKSMKTRDAYGYIIVINSVTGHQLPLLPPGIEFGVYPGTKYAITATTEIIRQELVYQNNRKVRITSISPGLVKTNILKASGYTEQQSPLFESPHLQPDDIGETVAYLLSTPYHLNVHEIIVRATGSQ